MLPAFTFGMVVRVDLISNIIKISVAEREMAQI